MEQKISDKSQTLANFIVFFIFSWGLISIAKFILTRGFDIQQKIPWSILTIIASAIVSLIAVVIKNNNDLKIQIRTEQKENKVEIYEELTKFYFRVAFSSVAKEETPQEEEIGKFLLDYTPKLVMWGSDEVLKCFYELRYIAFNAEGDGMQKGLLLSLKLEDLIFQIRKDLGHHNKNLKQGTILGLFVSDIDNLLPK